MLCAVGYAASQHDRISVSAVVNSSQASGLFIGSALIVFSRSCSADHVPWQSSAGFALL
jgi:hypothetical protein